MRKEFGNPPLHHSCSLFTFTESVAKFNTDINPHWVGFRFLVDMKMFVLVMVDVNITENDGVSVTFQLDHRFWATGDWRCRNHDSGHDHINGCL